MKFIVATIFRKPELLNYCEGIKGLKVIKNGKGELEIEKDQHGKWVQDKWDEASLVDSEDDW